MAVDVLEPASVKVKKISHGSKRKHDDAVGDEGVSLKKRSKKLKSGEVAKIEANVIANAMEDVSEKHVKEQRKEQKRAEKAAKKQQNLNEPESQHETAATKVASVDVADKERRKAEKAARKAAKAAKNTVVVADSGDNVQPAVDNAVHENGTNSKSTSGKVDSQATEARMNADKAARKAAKFARRPSAQLPFTVDLQGELPQREKRKMPVKQEKKQLLAHNKNYAIESNSEYVRHNNYVEMPDLTNADQTEVDEFFSANSVAVADPLSLSLRPILDFHQLPPTNLYCSYVVNKFKNPTPIQSASWPFAFAGRDLIGVAETGSGKTLAFGIPLARHIKIRMNSPEPGSSKISRAPMALVLTPTRELAMQIHEQITELAKSNAFNVCLAYGGVDKTQQVSGLKKVHVIVATPGRLKDYINMGKWDGITLERCKYVVLDEADRMLDKGFEDDVKDILGACPTPEQGRQTLMYTATWPPSIQNLASTYMREPVKISLGNRGEAGSELRANENIKQIVEILNPEEKERRLYNTLRKYTKGDKKDDRILVFCLYKREAARTEGFLYNRDFNVGGIHGDLTQAQRSAALSAFKDGSVPILVATDVAARGLDIPAVKLVLNYTYPLTTEDYVHRIGRTGRAGGLANVLRAAGQDVPEDLATMGGTVKKKGHDLYGAFVKDGMEGQTGTKTTFD